MQVTTQRSSLFSSLREAVIGDTHRDFTEERIGRAFHTVLAHNGIFAAIAISQSAIAVIAMLAFRQGKWKLRKV